MAEKFHFRFKIEARNFRHGAGTPEKKPTVSYPETESFLYTHRYIHPVGNLRK